VKTKGRKRERQREDRVFNAFSFSHSLFPHSSLSFPFSSLISRQFAWRAVLYYNSSVFTGKTRKNERNIG
jgi:hypothetical protein